MSQKMSFEEKVEDSKKMLEELIKPDITLSQSVKVYKKGIKTIQEARKMLDEAKLEYEELNKLF